MMHRLERLGFAVSGKEMPDKGGMAGFVFRVRIGQARCFENRPEGFLKIKFKQVFLQELDELQQLRMADV